MVGNGGSGAGAGAGEIIAEAVAVGVTAATGTTGAGEETVVGTTTGTGAGTGAGGVTDLVSGVLATTGIGVGFGGGAILVAGVGLDSGTDFVTAATVVAGFFVCHHCQKKNPASPTITTRESPAINGTFDEGREGTGCMGDSRLASRGCSRCDWLARFRASLIKLIRCVLPIRAWPGQPCESQFGRVAAQSRPRDICRRRH